jgi:hypothetical protein
MSSITVPMNVLYEYHAGHPRGTQDLLNTRLLRPLRHCMAYRVKLDQTDRSKR